MFSFGKAPVLLEDLITSDLKWVISNRFNPELIHFRGGESGFSNPSVLNNLPQSLQSQNLCKDVAKSFFLSHS
jgi:hypothetical protein